MKAKLLAAFLIISTLVCGALGFSITAGAATDGWTIGEIANYSVGDEFTVPVASVKVGGQAVIASGILICPDGTATTEQTVTLSDYGRYTLAYTAKHDGKVYSKDVYFNVSGRAATVSNEKSSVTYGKSQYATTQSGLLVRLAEGDTLRFTKAIDVSNVTKADSIIRTFATPDVLGIKDFKKLIFTLTDSENPDIYLNISVCHFWDSDTAPASYVLAGGQNQSMVGWEEAYNKLHVDNSWGTPINHTFTGLRGVWGVDEDTPLDELQIDLRYEQADNALYAYNRDREYIFVTDFDSSVYYNTFWTGFPSGKAFLSVKGSIYSTQTANFCVTHVKDVDITQDFFIDSDGPSVMVDYSGDQMPMAKVGTAYPVPTATAFDLYSGNLDVTTSVWYNYGQSNAVLAQVKNGTFTPSKEGTYVIEYSATDNSGNVSKKCLSVNAKNDVATPDVTFTSTPQTKATVGEMLYPTAYQMTCSANVGTVDIEVKHGDQTHKLDGNGIRLTEVGSYEVIYTVVDYIGQKHVKSYTVEVAGREDTLFLEQPVLPMYLISGNEYTLPTVYGYDYTSGSEVKVLATLEVTDSTGTRTVQNGAAFTPKASNNGDVVTVTYSANGYKLQKQITCIVPYVEVNGRDRLVIENYVQGNGIETEKLDNYMLLTATTADAGWTFANKLVAKNASIVFSGIAGRSTFSALQITFTDASDFANTVTVAMAEKNGSIIAVVGGTEVVVATTFDKQGQITVSYDGNGKIIVNGTEVSVTVNDAGKAFEGFGKYAYIGMGFVGATDNAQIKLISVDGQPMKSLSSDRVEPKIVINGSYGGRADKDALFTITSASAGDALAPNVLFTMSVLAPDGNPVTDINGKLLSDVDPTQEYTIKLEQYGKYKVSYQAEEVTDSRSNTAKFQYAINVVDTIAPTFTFKHLFPTIVAVGDVIVLPDFTVSDNLTAADDIVVVKMVISSDGTINMLTGSSNSIRATKAGVWEIRLVAYDAEHNAQIVRHYVEVK